MKKVKKTGLLLLAGAIFLGLVAGGLTFAMIQSSYKQVDVIVAKANVEEGDPLSKDSFEKKSIHPSGRPDDAVLIDEVDFSGAVASKGLLQGDILRKSHIVKINDSTQELPLISTRVKAIGNDGLVAAEIPIQSISGILNGIKKGDKVTIVSVRENPETETIESKTILVNIEVVAVQGDSEDDTTMDSATSGDNGVVAVALTSDEFKTLSLARDLGNIHIAVQPLGVEIDASVVEKLNVTANNSNTNGEVGQ